MRHLSYTYLSIIAVVVLFVLSGCSTSRRTVGKFDNVHSVVITAPSDHDLKHKGTGWWGDIYYTGSPWVTSLNKPYNIKKGLRGNHLTVWASHGRYYNISRKKWEWQRPNVFGTNEDLFTQTIVVPYVIPMLENAGAVVFCPRERDWQTNEIVVDNDNSRQYSETGKWKNTEYPGFSIPKNGLKDGDEPFTKGSARFTITTKDKPNAFAEYTPKFKESGNYAVYVSYQTLESSVDDAHYTVYHSGQVTEFSVNQQMGGGTWVYLGTFYFDNDERFLNGVVVDNHSRHGGKVTTDAVRFGGGMGTVIRGNNVSGLPRANEGARYYCQWAGAPYRVYSQRGGTDDYADDINSRSLMSNWLSGGSCYSPDSVGLRVPIELALALHSDAGFNRDFTSIYGSLGICTTNYNDGKLKSGISRKHSSDFADELTSSVQRDIFKSYGQWSIRKKYDRNYSETRVPAVPSAILEMFSHQSFPDMQLAHDPQFKFVISRAIYKAILRYVANSHGKQYVVAPLPPVNFRSSFTSDGRISLSWTAQKDSLESTAITESYVLYIAQDGSDFDNGRIVKSNNISIIPEPGKVYRFRVSALNSGGESFPSEELAAVYYPGTPVVLVANGFHRLASPQVVKKEYVRDSNGKRTRELGFDIDADPGLSYGKTPSWIGRQQVYDISLSNGEGPGTFGYTDESLGGTYIAGNDFDYVTTHVKAIASTRRYSAISCDARALPLYQNLNIYPAIDVLLGNERNDGYSLSSSPALPVYLRDLLNVYKGGLFLSGSYIASDATSKEEKDFLANRLHIEYIAQNRDGSSKLHGMGMEFGVTRKLSEKHYASTSSDILIPVNGAFPVLAYSNGDTAAIAYSNRLFVMGFPFECIESSVIRNKIMGAVLNFIQTR